MYKVLLLGGVSFGFGALAAAGVFTVLVAVGLVPRFAGKTHTGRSVLWYEEMVVYGTLFGGMLSIFPKMCAKTAAWLADGFFWMRWLVETGIPILFGLFSGMFVGCLALAIAEMLDSIPILSRRVRLRHGIGTVVLCIALGKLAGSLFYFFFGIS